MFLLALVSHIWPRQAAGWTGLLEIDAQGFEGLLALTKLQEEGIRDMRKKMSSRYDEDQVAEHKSQSSMERRMAPCHVIMVSSNEGVQIPNINTC